MLLLLGFAFLAGIVTILSPCILPVLPIVLSGGISGGKKRPIGIVVGFIASFSFFTLFLTSIVRATGISPDALRSVSVVIIIAFGLSLLVPKFQFIFERLASKLGSLAPKSNQRQDFVSGLLIGLSLGLVWTPCVGPILASVISLALTGSVTSTAFFITLAYAIGTSIPMLAIVWGGRALLQKVPWLLQSSGKIQKIFGVLMILTALAIATNLDRKFQTYILQTFPQYGLGLTKFEDNAAVKEKLVDMKTSDIGKAPELIPGGRWFNTEPLTLSNLKGKVVLVDFWTYTCINCIRTLPYLKSWHSKYKDKGLVIVGVHTPEFEFEKNPDNVARAIKDFDLEYPIMQDNDYATWNAYANHYWPAKYLIDKYGHIRYTHFGEGNYDETEKKIQELLEEAGSLNLQIPISNPSYTVQTRTPETYLGFRRMSGLASPERVVGDQPHSYTLPTNLEKNSFALSGIWTIGDERAMPQKGATLILHFDAQKVYLVMNNGENAGKVKISLDDQGFLPEDIKGKDVTNILVKPDLTPDTRDDRQFESTITVSENRLYELLSLPKPGDHILKLKFIDGNLELYAFTFG